MHLPIVILSGQEDVQLAVEAVSLGAQDYLPKGEANRSSLMRSIRYAIERSRRQRAEQELTAAGEIQRRLFPQNPPHGFRLTIFMAVANRPIWRAETTSITSPWARTASASSWRTSPDTESDRP